MKVRWEVRGEDERWREEEGEGGERVKEGEVGQQSGVRERR